MGNKIEVLIAQGLNAPNNFKDIPNFVNDVPNFVNDVSNFVNDISNFVKDMPRVPKFISRWRMTFNHYLRVLKG